MILFETMITLLVLGGLNLLGFVAMIPGPHLSEKEKGVVGVFAVQAVVFLLVGFTIMATLAATGQMPK